MLQKILPGAFAVLTINNVFGQDSAKTASLTVSGAADVYYRYDFAQSKTNNLTSFTNSHNSFELGMASVRMDYSSGRVKMIADLGFGKRAQEFSYHDEGMLAAINQLYLSYMVKDWLTLTAGSWATHVGYELVNAYTNRNYSMSYMFTNGPFFHTGLKAEVTTGKSGFMIGVVNPTDFKYIPDHFINRKFLIAQYSFYGGDMFKAYLNYAGGQWLDTSKSKQLDIVVTSQVSNKFSLAFNGTISYINQYAGKNEFKGYQNWWAAATYINYDPTKKLGFTLRTEYFSDKSGLKYTGLKGEGCIVATTLSSKIKSGNLILIPELRMDAASNPLFSKGGGAVTNTAAYALLAVVYQF